MEEQAKLPGLFDWVESINNHKRDLMETEESEKAYDAFMVRRALGMNKETLFLASRLNELHGLDSYAQYQYLLCAVPKKKRYSKWAKKPAVSDDIKIISRVYQVNLSVALSYRRLLTDEQMEHLKFVDSGGGADKPKRGKK